MGGQPPGRCCFCQEHKPFIPVHACAEEGCSDRFYHDNCLRKWAGDDESKRCIWHVACVHGRLCPEKCDTCGDIDWWEDEGEEEEGEEEES